ncbi:MAG: AmmeMemoRadiSam system protein A [Deltaproteobacteria bacterium]|jgi:AmmeMemoRadiSam system protein A|nr:AmmeMemoRadiSam system protein A [Deltaproteobacteria bacterium]
MSVPEPRLTKKSKLRLLEIAREAVFYRLQRGSVPPFSVSEPELLVPAGAFVSLHLDGNLRGCIGSMHATEPLFETVADMAIEAATNDPRFPQLTPKDLSKCDLEVSVLTPFVPIEASEVVPGKHGLYVVRGPKRGVLLPQVATQYGWSREKFLAEICRKAGLPEDAWRDKETRLFAFEAEVFSDSSLAV